MKSVGENSLLLRASAVRGGIFYKLDISPLKPGVKGKARGFMSWERPGGQMVNVALFRTNSGKFVLIWDNRQNKFSRWSWTPVSAHPTRRNIPRKDGLHDPKSENTGYATPNPFNSLLKPEKKKVVPKLDHFPPLQGATGNHTSSTYNPAWGGNARKRIKDVKEVEKAKIAAKQAALAKKKTEKIDPSFKIPVFVPKVKKLTVGLDEDDEYDAWQCENDAWQCENDACDDDEDKDEDEDDNDNDWGPGDRNRYGVWS